MRNKNDKYKKKNSFYIETAIKYYKYTIKRLPKHFCLLAFGFTPFR